MSSLDRQVGRASRRLNANTFLHWASRGVLIGAGALALGILVERTFVVGLPLYISSWAAAGVAGLIALVGALVQRSGRLRAALAVDRAAGLKERLSTALAIRGSGDDFAAAAVRDAERTAERVHVPAHVPIRAPRNWPWSAAVLCSAFLLLRFMPTLDVLAGHPKDDAKEDRLAAKEEQREIRAQLEQQLNSIKEMAENNPALKDLAKDIAPLDLPETPGIKPEDVRVDAVKRIDDVKEKLEREKQDGALETLKDFKQALAQLERMNTERGDDPGSKLGDSLAKGDFKGAKEALDEMKKELEKVAKDGDPEAKAKVAEMEKKLEKLAEQIAKLGDTTKLEKELENKAGLTPEEAKKLLDQLKNADPNQLQKELQKQLGQKGVSEKQIQELAKKIQQQQQSQKSCQNMAQSLSKAAKSMQQCDSPNGSASAGSAANALSEMAGQLSDMEMSEQMMNELEAQLSELQNLRDKVCEGSCSGKGDKPSDKIGGQGPNYGQGYGSRIGKEKQSHGLKPSKENTKNQGGAIIGQMLVDGPQVKGQASAEVQDAVNAAVRDAEDAIQQNRFPRQYDRVMREFYERLAGLSTTAPPTTPAQPAQTADEKQPK